MQVTESIDVGALVGRYRGEGGPRGLKEHRDMAPIRRQRIEDFADQMGVTISEWARLAELKSPNTIYNFLAGRTSSLAPSTMQSLADAFGVTPEDIMAATALRKKAPEPKGVTTAMLRVRAKAGLWRRAYDIPKANQRPIQAIDPRRGKIDEGVLVEDDSVNLLYPSGSILLIWRLDNGAEVMVGDSVVVCRHRQRDATKEMEVTVRRVEEHFGNSDIKMMLSWKSRNQRYIGGIPLPWPYEGGQFANPFEPDSSHERVRYEIMGVVQQAILHGRED